MGAPSSDVIDGDDDDEEFYETEPLPILGRCKALYPFEGEFFPLLDTGSDMEA